MLRPPFVRVLGLALLGAIGSLPSTVAPAQESWADPDLPVRDALAAWVDAGRLNEARRARGLPALSKDGRASVVFDSSGASRHFVQNVHASQPTYIEDTISGTQVAALRFDGDDDHLIAFASGRSATTYTVFLVARVASNPGGFRAFFATQAFGKNDYTSGINIDLGFLGSATWSTLNVEGPGYGGAVDLKRDDHAFDDAFHIIAVRALRDRIEVAVDGIVQGSRPRDLLPASLDQLVLGARVYSNAPPPPWVQGFLEGEIAEALFYERALSDEESAQVISHLKRKQGPLLDGLAFRRDLGETAGDASRVKLVPETPGGADGPAVEILVPGFEVKELPLELRNVNNLRYRTSPDDEAAAPTLVALSYDGRILLLRDSDGDELEDDVSVFWDRPTLRAPIGMALTPPGYRHGFGVFVASKGKLSLIVDKDGDDRADDEIIVATGWPELPHGVDTLGVAVGRDESIYFGLGCTNYTNAYLIDPRTKKAGYRLDSERGTILRVSPDFSRREIVCTGIRFPVGLAFNRHGDLFATDQEGETWLPGGNPRDELLHILPARHYGFPPRHAEHLPDVVDEPSVFDYGPQHQSTCGLVFNEPEEGRPSFGPAHFAGNVFVAGYSRGIIYRTQLHRRDGDPARYTARTSLFARLGLLTVDACLSPRGDLVVATHSGGPDWGSGPQGEGKLFRIRHVDREAPQPIAAWAESPLETRVTFDRPISPESIDELDVEITYGDAVRAADRFEVHRPPYEVVVAQLEAPRYRLPVEGTTLAADHRTLIIRTRPHPYRTHYAIRAKTKGDDARRLALDLDYDLCGAEARWTPVRRGGEADSNAMTAWTGWIPHLEPAAALAFLEGSARAKEIEDRLDTPGELVLRTALGALSETQTLVVRGGAAFRAGVDGALDMSTRMPSGDHELRLTIEPTGASVPLEIRLETGEKTRVLALSVSLENPRDAHERALSPQAHFVPWSAPRPPSSDVASASNGTIAAGTRRDLRGHWLRGESVFFGEGRCSTCHKIRGRGREIGPDLSNLVHRDLASVEQDIKSPSARIHPDYVNYAVITRRGDVLSGLLRARLDGKLSVFDSDGKETVLEPGAIATFEPSATSLMPENLAEVIGAERLDDLLSFLLVPPPSMPDTTIPGHGAPRPRTESEVRAALAGSETLSEKLEPLEIVLVAGPKDHGPGEHDYPAWQKAWERLLALAPAVRVTTAWEWPEAEDFERADVMVFFQKGSFDEERGRAIDGYLARGGGLLFLHYAVDGGSDPAGFAKRIGLAWQGGRSRFRHGDLELRFADSSNGSRHPIARNFERLDVHDESYWALVGDPRDVDVIATGLEEGAPRPLLFTREVGRGRIFVSILGHYSTTFDDPLFRLIVLRAIAWCAKEPVDRLNDLVWPGANVLWEEASAEDAAAAPR